MKGYYYAEYQKQWAKDNPDKVKANKKRYRDKLKESGLSSAADRRWMETNPEKCILRSSRSGAKARGIVHELTIDDIVLPACCPVFGVPFDLTKGKGRNDFSPSVDRIDNSKGYTRDNIQIISTLANSMKNKATKEQLIQFANWIKHTYEDME